MLNDMGQPGASRLEKTVASADRFGCGECSSGSGAAVAPPGTYTVKVAVVDESGRRGSVERTITARLNGFGQLHATDLLLADNTRAERGRRPSAGRRGSRRATSCTPTSNSCRRRPNSSRTRRS